MQRTCLFFILLITVALSIPSRAAAQYTLTKISGDGQTGFPGQTLQPFVVQISPVAENIPVTFAPSHGPVSDLLVHTDADGASTEHTDPWEPYRHSDNHRLGIR